MNKEILDYILGFWKIARLTYEATARKAAAYAAIAFGFDHVATQIEALPMLGKVAVTVYDEDKTSTAPFRLNLNGISFDGKIGISQRNKTTVMAADAVYTTIRPEREGYVYSPVERKLKLTDATTKVIFKESKKPVVVPTELTARWGWTPINPKDTLATRDVFPDYVTIRGTKTVANSSDDVSIDLTGMPSQQFLVYEEDETMILKKQVLDTGATFNNSYIPDSTWQEPILRNGRRIYYTRIATDFSKTTGAMVVFK